MSNLTKLPVFQVGPLLVTEEAMKQIHLAEIGEEKFPWALRIGLHGGGCSGMRYLFEFIEEKDFDLEDDKEYLVDNIKFVIDVFSEQYLVETTLDYVKSLKESGFKFQSDKFNKRCGCGSSFSI